MPRGAFETCGFFVARSPLLPIETITSEIDLDAILAIPEVRLGLQIASAEMARAIAAPSRTAEEDAALRRYVLRASSRCTPFGMFAGYSIGDLGSELDGETSLQIVARDQYRRRSSLDRRHLLAIARETVASPALRDALPLLVNPTATVLGGRVHVLQREGGPVALELDDALESTMRTTVASWRDRRALLVADGAEPDEADAYLADLCELGALLVDVAPPLVGAAQASSFSRQLVAIGADTRVLDAQIDALHRADAAPVGPYPALPITIELEKPALALRLSRRVESELLHAVERLHRLCASEPRPMADFIARFDERYGQCEVPLLQALDEELGIGYLSTPTWSQPTSQLVAQLARRVEPRDEPFGARERLLRSLCDETLARGSLELALDDAMIDRLALDPHARPQPSSFALATIARDETLHLRVVGAPSAMSLLARQAVDDPRLTQHLRALVDADEVEVAYAPNDAASGVLCRPTLRDDRIELFGSSSVQLADLMVSIDDDEVVLRSRRTGRRVVPRIASAHDVRRSTLALYRFLNDLQYQSAVDGVQFRWGALAGTSVLPRVRLGDVVVALARWTVRALPTIGDRGIPRWVTLVDGDDNPTLPIDLDSTLGRAELTRALRKGSVTLCEMFPTPDQHALQGPEGTFASELIVPLCHPRPVRATRVPLRAPLHRAAPGSEWLYVKLYTGAAMIDRLLVELAPILREAPPWFFVRYRDPRWHLRLRFHGEPDRLLRELLPALHAWVAPRLASSLVASMQLDTYARETARYEAIDATEALFAHESRRFVDGLVDGSFETVDARRHDLLATSDQIFAGLGVDLVRRHRIALRRRDVLVAKQNLSRSSLNALGAHFRRHHAPLAAAQSAGLDARRAELLAALPRSEQLAIDLVHMHVLRLFPSAHVENELQLYDEMARLYAARVATGSAGA